VSGLSSGGMFPLNLDCWGESKDLQIYTSYPGYFAVQMHVAFSATIKGAAIYAGGPYNCAQGMDPCASLLGS